MVEVFDDEHCAAMDLIRASYEVQDCTGPNTNNEGYEYYSKVTCSSSEKTRSFYTDTACTMDHPNITDNTETLACTSNGGSQYKKITCSAKNATATVYLRFPDGDDDCSESPIATVKFTTYPCMKNSEGDDGNWTEAWQSVFIERGRLGGRKYTTEDCTDTPTMWEEGPSPGVDTWVCGQCTKQGTGSRYAKIQCPSAGPVSGAPRDASPGPLLAAAAAALMLMAAGAA